MELSEATFRGFRDELHKIAGTGLSRIGIRPMKAATMAGKKATFPAGAGRFVKKNFMTKMSTRYSGRQVGAAFATGMGAALYGERKAKKAVTDWQTGRELRMQQEGR